MKIDISSEIARLEKHLETNRRTILSARFGDGKTYFLREYIAQHQIWKDYTPIDERIGSKEDTYFVVLHPVNYSVARNEDVFEYIKRDILLQMYQEGKLASIDYKAIFGSIGDLLKEKALPMFGDLVSLLPGGNIAKEIIKQGCDIKKRYDQEKTTVSDFIDAFVSQKGGIYEDDAYTQLIRTTLNHLREPKEGERCKKVLIIEDLDRLDPAHMFRILNVLGAHIDIDTEVDKFGFDNIILVMDYEVTRSIFQHFYGRDANYEGYMSKFLSHNLFGYSLLRQAHQFFFQELSDSCLMREEDIKQLYVGRDEKDRAISLYERVEGLSVRDIINIITEIDGSIISEIRVNGENRYSTLAPITRLLVILVRMHAVITKSDLENFIWQDPLRMSCLDGFLLEYSQLRRGILSNGRKIWYSFSIEQDKNGLSHMSVRVANGGYPGDANLQDIIRASLGSAIQYVPDAQQLLRR